MSLEEIIVVVEMRGMGEGLRAIRTIEPSGPDTLPLTTHFSNKLTHHTHTHIAGMQYSALRQLRPMFRLAPRRPFPPVENPWAYVRASQADVEFSMTK